MRTLHLCTSFLSTPSQLQTSVWCMGTQNVANSSSDKEKLWCAQSVGYLPRKCLNSTGREWPTEWINESMTPKRMWAALLQAALLRAEEYFFGFGGGFLHSLLQQAFMGTPAIQCHMVNSVLLLANLVGAAAVGKPGNMQSFHGEMEGGQEETELWILEKRSKFIILIF